MVEIIGEPSEKQLESMGEGFTFEFEGKLYIVEMEGDKFIKTEVERLD